MLRLTYNPKEPSILCECGFLTNPAEAATVREEDFRQRIAEGLAEGIIDQEEHGDVGVGALPPITVTRPPVHHHSEHGSSKHAAGKHIKSKHTAHSTASHRKHTPTQDN